MEKLLSYLGSFVLAYAIIVVLALLVINTAYWWPRRKYPKFKGFKDIHYRVDHYDGIYSFDVEFQMPPADRRLFGRVLLQYPGKGIPLPMIRIESSLHPNDPLDGRWAAALTGAVFMPTTTGYEGRAFGEVCFEHPDKHPIPTLTAEEFRIMGDPVLDMIERQLEQYIESHGHRCKIKISQLRC